MCEYVAPPASRFCSRGPEVETAALQSSSLRVKSVRALAGSVDAATVQPLLRGRAHRRKPNRRWPPPARCECLAPLQHRQSFVGRVALGDTAHIKLHPRLIQRDRTIRFIEMQFAITAPRRGIAAWRRRILG